LQQPRNLGKALALNAGIAAAQADYVIVLDADTIPDADFLKSIITPLLKGDADAVAGNVKVGNRGGLRITTLFQSIEYVSVLNTTRLMQGFSGTITTIPGAAGAMRVAALRALGGYSPTTRAEDADLTLRLVNQGFRTEYAPQAIVRTEAPSTWRTLYYQRIRWI
jgi:cellulose synthase/poly-beta-1,6-N-acetylglucosamine synthase-like glycosyltransferase